MAKLSLTVDIDVSPGWNADGKLYQRVPNFVTRSGGDLEHDLDCLAAVWWAMFTTGVH